MNNNHIMITRSKKIDISNNPNNDIEDEEIEEIDEFGNIKGFIDYSYDEDFDKNILKQELNKFKKRKIYTNYNKNKKIKFKNKEDNINKKKKIEEIFLNYIIASANNKLNNNENNNVNNNENIKINILENEEINSDSDSDSEYQEINSDDEYDYKYEELVSKNKNIDNYDYFHKLETCNKQNVLKQLEEINTINKNNIPLKFKILNSNMNLKTKSIAFDNISKLEESDNNSGEYTKMEHWISALVKIPFGIQSKLPIDYTSSSINKKKFLKKSNTILNESIYGHVEAKNNILQTLAKWISNPTSVGNIIALQGPMGNGKTTLVKEGISKAIDRPFAFVALGGSSDASYFDGHNFTYEGSRWGRIVDILIEMKCMNPIIYFDELDKISDTSKGDEIVNLLTHLTDLTQNNCYQDKYFHGVDIDLSKVLFIFSFNDEQKVNRILKDRMHVIRTKGFDTKDKINITNDYLLKQIYNTYNFDNKINISNDIITHIIENYTEKEEGVRNLKRCLDNIVSKINMYEMLYDEKNKKLEIDLPYTFENFKLPYTLKKEDIDNLLNKDSNNDKPPQNMYL
jgi:ATP-dependent Lon protease